MMLFADNPDQGRQGADKSRIVSIPFFPEIDVNDFREVMRVEANISDNRAYHAVLEAVAHVNGQLKAHRLQAVADGIATLAQTAAPDDIINGESVQVHHYRRAAYCYAKALLLEKYADTEPTGKAEARGEIKQAQAEDYRREAHFAVAAIAGRHRCDSELI